jgi:hypothetical protein
VIRKDLSEAEAATLPEPGGEQAAVVAKPSAASSAAAGVSAMITRSKLVEQLRDYQIRSQHK